MNDVKAYTIIILIAAIIYPIVEINLTGRFNTNVLLVAVFTLVSFLNFKRVKRLILYLQENRKNPRLDYLQKFTILCEDIGWCKPVRLLTEAAAREAGQ